MPFNAIVFPSDAHKTSTTKQTRKCALGVLCVDMRLSSNVTSCNLVGGTAGWLLSEKARQKKEKREGSLVIVLLL